GFRSSCRRARTVASPPALIGPDPLLNSTAGPSACLLSHHFRLRYLMKTDIHPDYQAIVFRDLASGETFLTRSTLTSEKTIELDGETYPVVDVEISSASHPFYTGKQRILDSAGRVEKFNTRYKNFGK